jgi:lambda repressor-like predicted transcriptional regulator
MNLPPWIDRPRDRRKRAQLRLKYMLSVATLRKYGRTSIHDLARDVGCNHSSIFNAISRGYFTEPMAMSIERVLSRDEIRHEWLVAPLEMEVEAT